MTAKKLGRKPLDPNGTVVIRARATQFQKATFDAMGGSRWLRDLLDAIAGGQRIEVERKK